MALVDATITRSLVLSAEQIQEVEGQFNEAGLQGVVEFAEKALNAPPDVREYYSKPWTAADNRQVNLRRFADIVRLLDPPDYLRVEGNATNGFIAKLNLSGVEFAIDMLSEASIQMLDPFLEIERAAASQAAAAG